MGSTRLPNKVMRRVGDTPLIGLLLQRLSAATLVDQIVLATSVDPANHPLADYVSSLGFLVFRGSELDVLDRYYQTALLTGADVVVRVTGDCPLIDPALVDQVIASFHGARAEYASNVFPPTYPDGLDTEVFSFDALRAAWSTATSPLQREHVTPFIRDPERFACVNVASSTDASGERWTVDTIEDFMVVERVFAYFHPRRDFSWGEVLKLRQCRPAWFSSNQHLTRNAGA